MFEMAVRSLCKTMFAVGYDAGREQARIDAWFEGSDLDDEDPDGRGASGGGPRGLLPSA